MRNEKRDLEDFGIMLSGYSDIKPEKHAKLFAEAVEIGAVVDRAMKLNPLYSRDLLNSSLILMATRARELDLVINWSLFHVLNDESFKRAVRVLHKSFVGREEFLSTGFVYSLF